MQPATPGRGAVEPAANGQQVELIVYRPTNKRRWQPRVGAGVGIEGDNPLACCGLDALLQCPGLAGPARRKLAALQHPRSKSFRQLGGAVARLVIDDDHFTNPGRSHNRVEERAEAVDFVASRDDDADLRCRRAACSARADRLRSHCNLGEPSDC